MMGMPHTHDHLATLLWSESRTSDARHSLRSSLYRLRQTLRSGGAVSALIITRDQVHLQLDKKDVWRYSNKSFGNLRGETARLFQTRAIALNPPRPAIAGSRAPS
jgi:two-component SAPR family response regulator